jgi:hypothetical protein
MRARAERVARELAKGGLKVESGKADMLRARAETRDAWRLVGDILLRQHEPDLARQVRRFADHMPPAMTEKEAIAVQMLERDRTYAKGDRGPFSR